MATRLPTLHAPNLPWLLGRCVSSCNDRARNGVTALLRRAGPRECHFRKDRPEGKRNLRG